MLRITAWLLIALTTTQLSTAQRDYKKGYLLLSPHDTLWGYINFYSQKPSEVYFIGFPGDKPERYYAEEAIGFQIDEDSITYRAAYLPFYSYYVDRKMHVVRRSRCGSYFVRPLVEGPRLSLYKLTGFEKYYINAGNKFEELCMEYMDEDRVIRDAGIVVSFGRNYESAGIWVYDYRNVLGQYIKNGDTLRPYLEQLPFDEDAFRGIIARFNHGEVHNYPNPTPVKGWTTFFVGLETVLGGVMVPPQGAVPEVNGSLHVLPVVTAGIHWREKERAGPFSGSIAACYSALNSQFRGQVDSLSDIYYAYKLRTLSLRGVFDYRVKDFGLDGGLSVGIFAGYHFDWLDVGKMAVKTPSNVDLDIYGGKIVTGRAVCGLHVQCLLQRFELSGFLEWGGVKGRDNANWYAVNYYQTGLGLYYHF